MSAVSEKHTLSVLVENKPGVVLRPTVVGLESGKVYNLADDISCASILIL